MEIFLVKFLRGRKKRQIGFWGKRCTEKYYFAQKHGKHNVFVISASKTNIDKNETVQKHMGKVLAHNELKTHVNKTSGPSKFLNIIADGSKTMRFPYMKNTFVERVGKRGEAGMSISS